MFNLTACKNGDEVMINGEVNNQQTLSTENMETVLNGAVDATHKQTFPLWEQSNMPHVTEYTKNDSNYADDPDFQPYLVTFPVPEGTSIKGAVLICAGGAFEFRSDQNEGTPVVF